jgi:hypothetical protein
MPNKTTRPCNPRRNGAGRKTTPGKYNRGGIDRRTRAAQRVTFGEGPAAATLDALILKRSATALPSPGVAGASASAEDRANLGQGEGGIWSLQPLALRHQSLPKCPRCGVFIPFTSVTCDTCPTPQPL